MNQIMYKWAKNTAGRFMRNLQYQYSISKKFRNARDTDKPVITLFGVPEHGNIGDHAIIGGEKRFFEHYFPDHALVMITAKEWARREYQIKKLIRHDDKIIMHGGGFIGTLWPEEEDGLRRIVNSFPHNRLVVFPQTVYFEDSDLGRLEEENTKRIWQSHSNFHVCLRDQKSYDFVYENLIGGGFGDIHLIPDIVLFRNEQLDYDRDGILGIFRSDKEKVFRESDAERLYDAIKATGQKFTMSDMAVDGKVTLNHSEAAVQRKLDEFRHANLVITDRLHGMIFAAITGTPCIAFNNLSGKVGGVYQWINYLPYVKFYSNLDEALPHIASMAKLRSQKFENTPLMPYYRQLRDIVAEDD